MQQFDGNVVPLRDNILVKDMSFSERKTKAGIILLSDNARSEGIRPRWAQVYAIGPKQEDVKVGQYLLIEHGRWSRGVKIGLDVVSLIDNKAILAVSDMYPTEDDSVGVAA
jgi:co-chaperonin GroES (HSP10)